MLISRALKEPSSFDKFFGYEKPDWVFEVIKKFNLIAALNYLFREGIKFYYNKDEKKEGDVTLIKKIMRRFSSILLDVALKEEQISAIREQYAKFKYNNKMNLDIIDELLGKKFKIFSQFRTSKRRELYELATYNIRKD